MARGNHRDLLKKLFEIRDSGRSFCALKWAVCRPTRRRRRAWGLEFGHSPRMPLTGAYRVIQAPFMWYVTKMESHVRNFLAEGGLNATNRIRNCSRSGDLHGRFGEHAGRTNYTDSDRGHARRSGYYPDILLS